MTGDPLDDAYLNARDAGLSREAAADCEYDVWRGMASPWLSEEDMRDEYGHRDREDA